MPILDADYSRVDYEDMAKAIGLKSKHIPILIANFIEESVSILDALEENIASRDYEKIRSSAHEIKGSAGNLKFNEVYDMAKEMEFSAAKQDMDFEYEDYFDAIKSAIGTISL
ncbi:MAG: histidine kinase [Sulfurimonas sp. RIFCSPHIGHO2_12_FULL_36_9]|uniref:Hpt domain-containing protein n=1 Tax=Sulfurimonas sp. RIFCSPLOWO2_12_36_12 TaxID=1802253 RepID=UPI0008B9BE61|nr:Hpt domain-containing protein [Sulfurimonas sp. RIFCSPLOWO2_12_36_12]OHD96753.1 MAG: histidine kinase [Sulfurimonas sp. RIFCSPHIGHO2_12_FULL_36_9]OHD98979.1 MAG: histidine kinase [Sulfurimonas sp. RIFCSPLOWO2_02_FULL_36_28]OHE02076.1 MAG: histidine kinase [Sulfurimonas sp. RIFCSPLOWO2_12_36_12]